MLLCWLKKENISHRAFLTYKCTLVLSYIFYCCHCSKYAELVGLMASCTRENSPSNSSQISQRWLRVFKAAIQKVMWKMLSCGNQHFKDHTQPAPGRPAASAYEDHNSLANATGVPSIYLHGSKTRFETVSKDLHFTDLRLSRQSTWHGTWEVWSSEAAQRTGLLSELVSLVTGGIRVHEL